jgi:hypothetical protein
MCFEVGGSMFLRNVGELLMDYTAAYRRKHLDYCGLEIEMDLEESSRNI